MCVYDNTRKRRHFQRRQPKLIWLLSRSRETHFRTEKFLSRPFHCTLKWITTLRKEFPAALTHPTDNYSLNSCLDLGQNVKRVFFWFTVKILIGFQKSLLLTFQRFNLNSLAPENQI